MTLQPFDANISLISSFDITEFAENEEVTSLPRLEWKGDIPKWLKDNQALLPPEKSIPPTTMLDFLGEKNARPESKIFTTLGTIPSYIDRSQPPTKKLPWRVINEVGFVRAVEMILPEELYELTWKRIDEELKAAKYAKVIMKLEDVLDGDFFTEYVKKGKQNRILHFCDGNVVFDAFDAFTYRSTTRDICCKARRNFASLRGSAAKGEWLFRMSVLEEQ